MKSLHFYYFIINAIASLKNNKASSFDQILNEMLKFGQTYIIDPLCKLFNNILSTGKFPVVWVVTSTYALTKTYLFRAYNIMHC
jgi:hypothetical protein